MSAPELQQLEQRRRLLVALSELQRGELRLQWHRAPWRPAISVARTAWRLLGLLRSVLRRR